MSHTALASPAYYIGCLGSRRTYTGILDRLRETSFDEDAIKPLRAPVRLVIYGRDPGEVAVSNLAEIFTA